MITNKTKKMKIKIIIKIKRIIAKEIPTAMPIVSPFEFFLLFLWEDFWKFGEDFEVKGGDVEGIKGRFEIFAIWIFEENPPKTKIWANNSPAINPVKFEQVKEVIVTEVTWQLGFDDNKDDE